jgi:hypothetical protein
MNKNLEELGLPPHLLSLLEGSPAQLPSFPKDNITDIEDLRIVPGGPSSSDILRKREELLRKDIESLVQEVLRLQNQLKSQGMMFTALQPVINEIAATVMAVSGMSGNPGGIIEFFDPENGYVNSSTCIYEPMWGQATLPYSSSPQSQILRASGIGARPNTVIKFSRNYTLNSSPDWQFDETDKDAINCVDGSFNTSWGVPIAQGNNLAVSISVPPSLGANAKTNALCLAPFPPAGVELKEVWIRNGNTTSAIPGWEKLTLAGQVNYNSISQTIKGAHPCRFLFTASPVREILVVMSPMPGIPSGMCGLTYVDLQAIQFMPAGSLVLDAGAVGVNSVSRVILAGLQPSTLSDLPVTLNGTQVTIEFSSASTTFSPVITSVAFKPVAAGQESAGFDVSTYAP